MATTTLRSAKSILHNARAFSGRPVSARSKFNPAISRASMTTVAATKEAIEKAVTSNKVVVYSKTYCPYCSNVKSLFKNLKVDALVFELDNMDDGAALQSTLQSVTGSRTVPQVFVGGKFIGGCDDTMAALNSGKLKTIFQEAGVSATF